MPPFFLSPDPPAVGDHIAELARAVRIPILVQYPPNQTGLRLSAKFFAALADEFPHLRYVKVDNTPAGPMIISTSHREENMTERSNSFLAWR